MFNGAAVNDRLDREENSFENCLRLLEEHCPKMMRLGAPIRDDISFSQEDKKEMVNMFRQGYTLPEISKKCQCSESLVEWQVRYAREEGTFVNPDFAAGVPKSSVASILKLRKKRTALKSISAKTGLTYKVVKAVIHKHRHE